MLTISPLSRNMSAISTAALNKPARIISQVEHQPLDPFFLELIEGFLQFLGGVLAEGRDPDIADLFVFIEHEIPLIVGLAAVSQATVGTSMIARVMVIGSGSSEPSCKTLSLTSVPGRPMRNSAALSVLMPSADCPSISTIWSPAKIPASYAGVPTMGAITRSRPVSSSNPDLDADTAKLALDLAAKMPPLAGIDERRVRIEILQHSFQGTLEQLAARHRRT